MKPIRYIYNENYTKARIMLADKKFRVAVKKLKDAYTAFGCPIPKDGFSDGQEYFDWHKKCGEVYSTLRKSDAYKEGSNKITGGKERISLDEWNRLDAFEKDFFPPMYGYVFDDILREQGIDPKNEGFQSFLESHVFFNKQKYSESVFNIKWMRDKDTDKWELFIQILPHTTMEDIKDHFSEIRKEQLYFPRTALRNKKKIYLDRDLWIIKEYRRLKTNRHGKRPKTKRGQPSQSLEAKIQEKMPKIWGHLGTPYIRTIINRMRDS